MKKAFLYILIIISVFFVFGCSCGKNKNKENEENNGNEVVEKFTVMWMNYDGEILQQDNEVAKGTMASFNKATPTKPSDEYYDYQFDGWTPAISEVTSNRVYLAKFKQVQKEIVIPEDSFAIQWFNYDGTLLRVDYYKEGEMPEYHGETPLRESTNEYDFSFSSWLPEVVEVSGNATYMAQFASTKNYQLVSFDLDEGRSDSYSSGDVKVHGLNQTEFFFDVLKQGYTFKGWMVDDELVLDEMGNIVKKIDLFDGLVFKAKYEKKEEFILTMEYSFYDSIAKEIIKTTKSCDGEIALISKGGLYLYDQVVNLSCEAKNDYEFLGWYYNEFLLSEEEEYNFKMWDRDVTITALLKLPTYKLNVYSDSEDAVDGKVRIYDSLEQSLKEEYEEIEVSVGSLVTVSNKTFTECTFIGWYDIEGELVTHDAVFSFIMPAHDVYLHSRWNKFTINYQLNSGKFADDAEVPTYYSHTDENHKTIKIPTPLRVSHSFVGWHVNGSDEIYPTIDTSWEDNLTLFAEYVLDSTYDKLDTVALGDGTYKLTGVHDFDEYTFTVPDMISAIGEHAFENASTITKLVVPSTVKQIEEGGLYGLNNLVDLELPFVGTSANVNLESDERYLGYLFGTSIPAGASYSTYNRASQRPYNNGMPAAYYVPNITKLTVNGGKIGANALSQIESLKNLYIKGVSEIGSEAFVCDTGLETVFINNDTKYIGEKAFAVCSSLVTMEIPFVGKDGTAGSSLKEHLFAGWFFGNRNDYGTMKPIKQNGTSYVCPKNLADLTIHGGGLYTYALAQVVVENVLFYGTTIEESALAGSTVRRFESTSGSKTPLTRLGSYAFESCKELQEVQFIYGMKEWGQGVFRYCSNLQYCELNNKTYKYLNSEFFKGCTNLREVKFNTEGTMTISSGAFQGCINLTRIYLYGYNNFTIENANDENGNKPFADAKRYFYSQNKPTSSGDYWHWVDGYCKPW